MHPDLKLDLELALRAARAAGEVVMRAFRGGHEVRYKGPDQPVTDADLAADRILRDLLQGERPEYGWLSEETSDSPERLQRQRVWVVDPIDGTNSFVQGLAEFVVSVGLVEDGRAVLGVVYNPATGELYSATVGGGAFLDGAPIRVAAGEATAGPWTLLASRSEMGRGAFEPFGESWTIQPLGSTAYRMVKVAEGVGHAFISRGPKKEWDLCGAHVVVREAGGRVTDAAGEPLCYNRPQPVFQGVVASNGAVHDAILRVPAAEPDPS
ncbi:MAG: 3'(2'),5'-bisphosphate nucleotidase CysQ [Gemmatimonadota bacterium]|nr:3'(2'),5'-bisphosphate nucleotidase CysQ [Gemmatimonadota bacterium]